MWTYNYNDELYHFRVKGMKWGVRKNSNKSNLRNRYDSAKSELSLARKKKNKVEYKKAKDAYKSVKKERNQALIDTTKQLKKQSTFGDKIIRNSHMRKAAKYVVDNDMPVKEAVKKARINGYITSAISYTALYGVVLPAVVNGKLKVKPRAINIDQLVEDSLNNANIFD